MRAESVGASNAPIAEMSSGGLLCLDFVDTVDWRLTSSPLEYLHDYADLVAWARREDALFGDVLGEEEASHLMRYAGEHPAQAEATLADALALREVLYRVLRAVAASAAPAEEDLKALNRALAVASAHARVVCTAQGYAWAWAAADGRLDRILWPVVRSAADLLTSGDLSRVRECEGDGCGWLLYDSSKNRSRRWCTMTGCGNRAKARRHYQRIRAGRTAAE